MPKFTPEEAERIIRESRETISRVDLRSTRDERREEAPLHPPVDPAPIVETETLNQRHRRELVAQEKQFRRERLARARQEQEERERWITVWAQACADQRVGELESQLCEVVKSTTFAIESLEHEIARTTGENRELKIKLAEVEIKLAELRLERAERKTDLPNPLSRVN